MFKKILILFLFIFLRSFIYGQQLKTSDVDFLFTFSNATTSLTTGETQKALTLYKKCLQLNKNSAATNYQISRIYLHEKDYETALGFAVSAVKIQPKNVWYSVLLAEIYEKLGNLNKAAETLEKAINDENIENFYENLVDLYIQQNNYSKAISVLQKIENLYEFDQELILKISDLHLLNNDIKNAETQLLKLIEYDKQNLNYHGILAEFYIQTRQYSKVEQILNQMLEIEPENGMTYLTYAYYCREKQDYNCFFSNLTKAFQNPQLEFSQKINIFLKILEQPQIYEQQDVQKLYQILEPQYNDSIFLHKIYANYLFDCYDFQQAAQHYNFYISHNYSDYNIYKNLYVTDYILEDYPQLLKLLQEAENYYPEQIDIYLYKTLANINQNQLKPAKQNLDIAESFGADISIYSNFFYLLLGMYNFFENNPNKMQSNFNKFLSFPQNSDFMLANYAYFISKNNIDNDKAEQILKRIIQTNLNNHYFYYIYALIFYNKQQTKDAEYFINKAINLCPYTDNRYVELKNKIQK